ncbi:MAG TPA: hypothetical protein VF588_16475 [Pyrinomonadaceae bacterium]|jgi:hypothetical protein
MPVYFKLGHGTRTLESAGNFPWPYAIDVCFDPVPEPVAISEGVAHGAAGGTFSASEAIGAQWREHFEAANAGWLIPYLERLAAGVKLPREEILARYKQLHGKMPDSYRSGFF